MKHDGQMASVRRFYGVPAYRGARVTFRGYGLPLHGTIISSTGSHLYMRLDVVAAVGGRRSRFGPLHPTWKMDYGDGRDYGAETDERLLIGAATERLRANRDKIAGLLPQVYDGMHLVDCPYVDVLERIRKAIS